MLIDPLDERGYLPMAPQTLCLGARGWLGLCEINRERVGERLAPGRKFLRQTREL